MERYSVYGLNTFLLIFYFEMEILILCNEYDAIALALFDQIKKNNKTVSLVIAEELIYARSWIHEIDSKGEAFTEIKLQNGKIIRSDKLKAAWNRIRFFPMFHFTNETDRYYAQNEISALFFSFLNSINKVLINPIDTHDLAVEAENLLYLKQQAVIAGLKVLDYHFTSSPRWKTSKNLIPFAYDKKGYTSFRKKAPYLIWQNQPSLLTEPSTGAIKLWNVNGKTTNAKAIPEEKALKKLSSNLNKIFLELDLVETEDGMKVSNINTFPLYAPGETITDLAQFLLLKAKKEV